MNLPQVYMCSPSWTLLPPPSPYHPSGSSECTSPKHPVSRASNLDKSRTWESKGEKPVRRLLPYRTCERRQGLGPPWWWWKRWKVFRGMFCPMWVNKVLFTKMINQSDHREKQKQKTARVAEGQHYVSVTGRGEKLSSWEKKTISSLCEILFPVGKGTMLP